MASVPTRRIRHVAKMVMFGFGDVSDQFLVVPAHHDLLLVKKVFGTILEQQVFKSQ